jgi:hypothetical protein
VTRCCKALPCTTLGIEDKMKRLIASFLVLSFASVWALSQTQVGVPAADAGHSSTVVSATAFRGSHSTGRNHSRSSSHRAKASGMRNRHGRIRRSAAAKHSFERQHPCPSTGRSSGRCPGYVIDHVNPLECGGADAPSNMQWQTVAAGKAKDKTERNCRL